ncbi:MAG: endonuclease/Exonuclease/phosphatase family protein [Bacteriovoracaceae bacterium]|nr:endonuclease/Exonuclease/phosphatase family protein [Bacteriovoracaceae bacterium]
MNFSVLFRRLYFWLVILSFVLISSESSNFLWASTDSKSLKVLNFNFNSESSISENHDKLCDLRYAAFVDWVREYDPDIILLQEGWDYRSDPSVALTIAREIGYDVAYRIDLGFPAYLYDSNAVLAKKSLLMTAEHDLKLPHSSVQIGNGKTWDIGFGAISYAIGVKLSLPDGETLYAYSTHFLASSVDERADQFRAIDEDIRQRAESDQLSIDKVHVLIGGDFNSIPTEASLVAAVQAGYRDSFAVVHPRDRSCSFCSVPSKPFFNPITVGAGQIPAQTVFSPDQRLDYILVRSPTLTAVSSQLVFTAPRDGVWLSDHYGVFTTFNQNSFLMPPLPTNIHDTKERDLVPAQIVKLKSDDFRCRDIKDDCFHRILDASVGSRGITFLNHANFEIHIDLEGPGFIFTSSSTTLAPENLASFVFSSPGDYRFSVVNASLPAWPFGAKLLGILHVENK